MNLENVKMLNCGSSMLDYISTSIKRNVFAMSCVDRNYKNGEVLVLGDIREREDESRFMLVRVESVTLSNSYQFDECVILGLLSVSDLIYGRKNLYKILKQREKVLDERNRHLNEIKIVNCETKNIENIASGKKKFELQYNDKNYKYGDILMLCDCKDGKYNNRFIIVEVTYICEDYEGLLDDYVILDITPISELTVDDIDLYERLKYAERL